ncbi:hypothetical protein Pla108_14300 [Botrimarina colliarenosi]|uniref:Uncharacterized protein n=1 Tax=Botrimarina colliarenosi TaxID=2528001 RepID=A0A5C6AMI8_9BACT|nr:hypothetical protein Pla108_14300 [Botrimarina colliarenosi]
MIRRIPLTTYLRITIRMLPGASRRYTFRLPITADSVGSKGAAQTIGRIRFPLSCSTDLCHHAAVNRLCIAERFDTHLRAQSN